MHPDLTDCRQAEPKLTSVHNVQEGAEREVDAYLRRKYASAIKEIVQVEKEDLDLKNHLSGRKRTLLQVRSTLLPPGPAAALSTTPWPAQSSQVLPCHVQLTTELKGGSSERA